MKIIVPIDDGHEPKDFIIETYSKGYYYIKVSDNGFLIKKEDWEKLKRIKEGDE